MKMVFDLYRDPATFPKQEMFGMTSQLRRAAMSVASNIAEDKGRFSDRELSQFLSVARGSLFEISTQLAMALELGYLTKDQSQDRQHRCAEVGRLLNGRIKAVRKPAA
jgi:four helix bundle protein